MLPLSCQTKRQSNLPSTVASKFARFESSWLQCVWMLWKKLNTAIEGSEVRKSPSGVQRQSTCRGQNNAQILRLLKLETTSEAQKALYNISRGQVPPPPMSSSNNSMVSRAQWAFNVSQGSVLYSTETLRRGGERLHDFLANLFRKLCTKFHQNRWSFIGDTLFSRTCCILCLYPKGATEARFVVFGVGREIGRLSVCRFWPFILHKMTPLQIKSEYIHALPLTWF